MEVPRRRSEVKEEAKKRFMDAMKVDVREREREKKNTHWFGQRYLKSK